MCGDDNKRNDEKENSRRFATNSNLKCKKLGRRSTENAASMYYSCAIMHVRRRRKQNRAHAICIYVGVLYPHPSASIFGCTSHTSCHRQAITFVCKVSLNHRTRKKKKKYDLLCIVGWCVCLCVCSVRRCILCS